MPSTPRASRPGALWAIAALTLLAFALRLFRIDAASIWWDEGISLHLARGSWAALLADRSGRLHPPLYFLLLKLWVGLAGDSVFAARALSLLGSLPGVALAYNLVARRRGRWPGFVAGAVTALAAVFVAYAQEVRVYALLPALYLLLLALADRLADSPHRRALWVALAFVEATALLMHYLSAIAILYANARLVLTLWRQRRAVWKAWLASQLAAAVLAVPWFVLVLARRLDVRGQLELGNSLSIDPLPLPALARLVWTFLLTGHDRARFVQPLPALAGLFALVLAAGAVWQAWAVRRERPMLAVSTLDWLLPVALATGLWILRPLSHPRYTLLWAGALWVWAGSVLASLLSARQWLARALGVSGIGLALALSAFSIRAYHFDPSLAKQDVRGVAEWLQGHAAPGDVALVPWQDQSLPYYDTTPASVGMLDFRQPDAAWHRLSGLTQDARHVYVMEYDHTTRDPLGTAAYALEQAGALEEVVSLHGLTLYVYRVDRAVEPPTPQPVEFDLGAARLVGVQSGTAPANQALTVALAWQVDGPTTGPLKASVRLRDSLGNTIALDDRVLYDPYRTTSNRWTSGQIVLNTYVLPLPHGTPPVAYDLAVGLYPASEDRPGQLQTISTMTLLPSAEGAGDPYALGDLGLDPSVSAEVAPGLRLVAATFFPREARPGDALDVTLRWQATGPLPDLEPSLVLEAGGVTLLDAPGQPANGQYPTHLWTPGEDVLDRRRIRVPPDAPPGRLAFSLALGDAVVPLGEVLLEGGSTSEAPRPDYPLDVPFGSVARLVGYDLSGDVVSPTQGLQLTLYWQALDSDSRDYTVFVHLVDATGALLGQHDFPPVWGVRPTSGWQSGEFLVDGHAVTLAVEATPQTDARLLVGLYDSDTGDRLPLPGGEDAYPLASAIRVEASP